MNYKLFFFVWALDIFYCVTNLLASPIIGGITDDDNAYKYHVSIRVNYLHGERGKHHAGGTIIKDGYVLSAAHPFMTSNRDGEIVLVKPRTHGLVVHSGTSATYGLGFITHVDRIYIPRMFSMIERIADVSVLKLAENLDVEHHGDKLGILPIDPGYSLDHLANQDAFILGNGYNYMRNGRIISRFAHTRQFLQVRIAPRDQNSFLVLYAENIDRASIRTSCFGDDGSPLVLGDAVIGVIAYAPEDCQTRQYISFTRIASFTDFIEDAKNDHVNHSTTTILED